MRRACLRGVVWSAAWSAAWSAGCTDTPPEETARIALWHDAPVPGGVRVYANGLYAGTLRHYVVRGTPRCSSTGTFTLRVPPATWVAILAESSDGRRWTRVVRADSGSCRTVLLQDVGTAEGG